MSSESREALHKKKFQSQLATGWRRLIGSPKLQIIFHKRATKYRSLLRKMTYKDNRSYESSPPCIYAYLYLCIYVFIFSFVYLRIYFFIYCTPGSMWGRCSSCVFLYWSIIYVHFHSLFVFIDSFIVNVTVGERDTLVFAFISLLFMFINKMNQQILI